ncbi:MAG: ribonuclease P protein component [Candidatus Paceibacterota bacterium]|jgi:ribonuclease P protein component
MLRKADRLTTKEVAALSKGKSVFGTLLSLRFITAEKSKFSVSVSKKVAPRAVDRNAVRRKLYDVLKDASRSLKKPVFAMVLPKKECLDAAPAALSRELAIVFAKAGLS